MDVEGLITQPSRRSGHETIDRPAAALESNGLAIFARIDQPANAAAVGMSLQPTELLIFGNARAGTPLMQLSQAIGIDLPLKALAWEDAAAKVWLAYNDPAWLARCKGLAGEAAAAVEAMAAMLAGLAKRAT